MLRNSRIYIRKDVPGHGSFSSTIYSDFEYTIEFNPMVVVPTMSKQKERRKKDGTVVTIAPEPRNFLVENIRFSFGAGMLTDLKKIREGIEQGFDDKQYVKSLFSARGKMALKSGVWEASESYMENFDISTLPPAALDFVHKTVGWCLDQVFEQYKEAYEAYSEIINISLTKE